MLNKQNLLAMNKSNKLNKLSYLLRFCLLAIAFCIASHCAYGIKTSVVVRFSEGDFAYSTDGSGKQSIICKKPDCSYMGVGLPVLPLVSKNYLLKSNQE